MLWKLLSQINIDPNELNIPKTELTEDKTATALELTFGIAGAIALLIIVLAGIRYTLSQGDPQSTNLAKNAIIYASIGLVVCALAFAIVRFVVRGVS